MDQLPKQFHMLQVAQDGIVLSTVNFVMMALLLIHVATRSGYPVAAPPQINIARFHLLIAVLDGNAIYKIKSVLLIVRVVIVGVLYVVMVNGNQAVVVRPHPHKV